MGSSLPYGLAAELALPDRPLVALSGDGAMQLNGVAELITISRLWRSWDDPGFVVLVLHNRELAEVTWDQREMEGEPRFEDSRALPDFPYARYAELLGLTGIKVDHPGDVDAAWRDAFGADRPVLIEAVVDADVPLLPSFPAGEQKLESFRRGLEHEGAAGEHSLNLLDEQAAQERLIT
jgi:pyruvate dehydrogenase (quinone)